MRCNIRMQRSGAIEVAKKQVLIHVERALDVRGQPTARLERDFEEDAKRHDASTVFGEIPGIWRNVIGDL